MFSRYIFIIFLLEISTAQFPNHLDLQKVGEVTLNNEKYNILKPTVHQVTDHFKDFILRRENSVNEKVFLDGNGLRHFWSGFSDNLRKDATNSATMKTAATDVKNKEDTSTSPAKEVKNTEAATSPATEVKKAVAARTMGKVSFFCPFFGVVNMNAFVD